MVTKNKSQAIELLIHSLDEGYSKRAWHGTNLRNSLRGLTMEKASWRPAPQRHNIWENIVHCAYWKHVVSKRITDGLNIPFPLKGSNWFIRPVSPTMKTLKEDIALLHEMHNLLKECVQSLQPGDLQRIPSGSRVNIKETIIGSAMHDVYHAGQIQLLKKLQGK